MAPNDGNKINVKSVIRLYKQNGCAKALLDHMAGRSYNSAESTVDRLEQVLRSGGEDCTRRDIIGVLKELESYNCGLFVIGRRGQASRFQWHVQMTALGKAAKGEDVSVEPLSADDAQPEGDEGRSHNVDAIEHSFNLRPGFAVTLELPRDLTPREAARLSEFVKTLPFEDSQGQSS